MFIFVHLEKESTVLNNLLINSVYKKKTYLTITENTTGTLIELKTLKIVIRFIQKYI